MAHRGRSGPWSAVPDGFPWQRGATPPWMAGLFGSGQPERGRGPQVRRGDVRAAIIDVLNDAARAEEQVNGYQVIGRIADKSEGAWRPSPGSVYPTLQQLQDEGLVDIDEDRGRRTVRLTAAGVTYADDHADERAAVWTPFRSRGGEDGAMPDLKPEIGQMMSAVWQIVTSGSDAQRRAAVDILIDTRRRLYGVLADGHDADPGPSTTG